MTRTFASNMAIGLALASAVASSAAGCVEKGPPRHITRIQAFRCAAPHQDSCIKLGRGAEIPRDSLPPVDEAFQVWAWHPGQGAVTYRIDWSSPYFPNGPDAPKQSGTEFKEAGDSTMLSYNFSVAARAKYVMRVLLISPKGRILDQDSLIWDFSHSAPAKQPKQAEQPEHHH